MLFDEILYSIYMHITFIHAICQEDGWLGSTSYRVNTLLKRRNAFMFCTDYVQYIDFLNRV